MMPWWVASILANVCIATIEYMNRVGGFPDFGRAVMTTWPLIIIAQLGLFYAWRDAPSFMFAWAFFALGNSILRVISAQYLIQEPSSWLTLTGVAVIFVGAALVKAGG